MKIPGSISWHVSTFSEVFIFQWSLNYLVFTKTINWSLKLCLRYMLVMCHDSHLWLFLRVVPSVLSPVMCRENLKILRIRKILKICAAFAIYSREYSEESLLRNWDTKKGRIPSRSIMLRNESRNWIWKCCTTLQSLQIHSSMHILKASLIQ